MKRGFLSALVITTAAGLSYAQSQPTYKCVTAGKASYSDEPCVGAIVVDTTPTQGLDKMTGVSKKGADVQKIELNKTFDQAIKPITGLTPEQMNKRRKRIYLSEKDKLECWSLDGQIQGTRVMDAAEEVSLYQARKRFKDLKC